MTMLALISRGSMPAPWEIDQSEYPPHEPPPFMLLNDQQRMYWDQLIKSKWYILWSPADLVELAMLCKLLEQWEYLNDTWADPAKKKTYIVQGRNPREVADPEYLLYLRLYREIFVTIKKLRLDGKSVQEDTGAEEKTYSATYSRTEKSTYDENKALKAVTMDKLLG